MLVLNYVVLFVIIISLGILYQKYLEKQSRTTTFDSYGEIQKYLLNIILYIENRLNSSYRQSDLGPDLFYRKAKARDFREIPLSRIQFRPTDETMSAFEEETVLSVHHWTDRLFSFTTTRNRSFRFRNGQFSMKIGRAHV